MSSLLSVMDLKPFCCNCPILVVDSLEYKQLTCEQLPFMDLNDHYCNLMIWL